MIESIDDILAHQQKSQTRKEVLQIYQKELARRELYKTRPDLWLVERFGEPETLLRWTKWNESAYQDHEWDGTKNPFYEVFKAVASGNWVGVESATGTGKTFILPRLIYWYLDVFENSLVVTTAPKQSQLKSVLWGEINACFPKFKRIRPQAEIFDLRIQVLGNDDKENTNYVAIGEVAGVKAGEEANVKMAGKHRERMLFVIDEMAGIPLSILNTIINTCSDPFKNQIVGVGNPDSETDTLHEFAQKEHVKHIVISAYDHPNIVFKKNNLSAPIAGAVTQESIDLRVKEYGELSNLVQSRVRGKSPKQSNESLIKLEWIEACVNTNHEPLHIWNAIGVDVANSTTGDKAAVCYGKANNLMELKEFQCPNANHLAYNLIYDNSKLIAKNYHNYNIPKITDYEVVQQCIGIDSVGVGAGTVNAFYDSGFHNVVSLSGGALKTAIPTDFEGKPIFEFAGLRDMMYFFLAQDLLNKQLNIKLNDQQLIKSLIKELLSIRYANSTGVIKIESKDNIKKRIGHSPNLADAVAYWNFVRKGFYINYSYSY